MTKPTRIAAAAALSCLMMAGTAAAQTDFLERFEGAWSGEGTVMPNEEAGTRNVDCDVTGTAGGETIDISGECRAMLIFSRDIGAKLTRSGDIYTGTYTGSKAGAAQLEGQLEGDTLNLTMTYPRPVNGDTKALMRITNPDDGQMTLTVLDQMGGTGEQVATTRISFQKQSEAAAN